MSNILGGVEWEPVEQMPGPTDLPRATHQGVLEIDGYKLRCYRLDDGRAVFDADDMREFCGGFLGLDELQR